MWHIYMNSYRKYEFAFIRKGRYIAGTKQGYERKKTMLSILYNMIPIGHTIQDDTGEKPIIVRLRSDGTYIMSDLKTSKKYIPSHPRMDD